MEQQKQVIKKIIIKNQEITITIMSTIIYDRPYLQKTLIQYPTFSNSPRPDERQCERHQMFSRAKR